MPFSSSFSRLLILLISVNLGSNASSAVESAVPVVTEEGVPADSLAPFAGETHLGVDPHTLTGKVMCGYQGWFNCEGDGAGRGWVHWTSSPGLPSPTNIKVDLWPDVSELSPTERFDTAFLTAHGRKAQVFSSFHQKTVQRHFAWMRDYGIDGVFVQRFAAGAPSPDFQRQNNAVLAHCRAGANLYGRTYALMYDLSGLGAGKIEQVMDDFRRLRQRMKLGEDPAYLHHRGQPLVAIWGIGFNDKRAYSLEDCRRLIEFFKYDPEVGGCAVMLGTPTYWREGIRDAVSDPALHEVLALGDVLSPWTVGRYGSPGAAADYVEATMKPDIAWCAERKIDYLPVLFPGFSWHNMYPDKPSTIPRLQGEFFWSQFRAACQAGAGMLYVAMFDEVDEGTAVFKCTNDVPISSKASFVTYEGLPSDYYLRLTGAGSKMLRGEISDAAPKPVP